MAWNKIEDHKVVTIWKMSDDCKSEGCETKNAEINPDWFQENGTPICECGQDMEYSHTEINQD